MITFSVIDLEILFYYSLHTLHKVVHLSLFHSPTYIPTQTLLHHWSWALGTSIPRHITWSCHLISIGQNYRIELYLDSNNILNTFHNKLDPSRFIVSPNKATGIVQSVVPVIKTRITCVGLHTTWFGVCCCDTSSRREHRDKLQWSLSSALCSITCKCHSSMMQISPFFVVTCFRTGAPTSCIWTQSMWRSVKQEYLVSKRSCHCTAWILTAWSNCMTLIWRWSGKEVKSCVICLLYLRNSEAQWGKT